MIRLEVFFDYSCPFCFRGYKFLTELLPDFPNIEVVRKPCEAHPRPEFVPHHSDLCIQGMYYAADNGVDLAAYDERLYALAQNRQNNIEDIDLLANGVADILDADGFRDALNTGKYREIQLRGNDYAYEESGVWAIPSYRMDGRRLDSVEGVGVTRDMLESFLKSAEV
jgi:predicted DsbA family dithiol-disulfide isomerase